MGVVVATTRPNSIDPVLWRFGLFDLPLLLRPRCLGLVKRLFSGTPPSPAMHVEGDRRLRSLTSGTARMPPLRHPTHSLPPHQCPPATHE